MRIDAPFELNDYTLMRETVHRIFVGDARSLDGIADACVSLVVTSPPYPMIEMWDDLFAKMNPGIAALLASDKPWEAFDLMHMELDRAWTHLQRILVPGGFVCINIGDATRTAGNRFRMYPNADRITNCFVSLGFDVLPKVIWRKTTNAPNKFMGSGMLPAGAYVTLEHEYVLIFRNGSKRIFSNSEDAHLRYSSAFFWEERNTWFSDIWFGLNGANQSTSAITRERNGAYPLELPYRLINMFSVKGDTVLDPFLGTGTTTLAALASARNSIGVEIDRAFVDLALTRALTEWPSLNELIDKRLVRHRDFVEEAGKKEKELRHFNSNLRMPVMTRQETEATFEWLQEVGKNDQGLNAKHSTERPIISNDIESQLSLFET